MRYRQRYNPIRTITPVRVGLPVLALLFAIARPLSASAIDPVTLTMKDHRFTPGEVDVPAGVRFRIEVENQDPTPAEFESTDLRVEKIVVPGGRVSVMVGPLRPGTYKFFDDYHPDTATGIISAAEPKE